MVYLPFAARATEVQEASSALRRDFPLSKMEANYVMVCSDDVRVYVEVVKKVSWTCRMGIFFS